MGASYDEYTGTVNFAVFSSGAVGMSLCLFTEDDLQAGRITYEIPLDPALNKTGDIWHVMLPNLDTRLLYGYKVFGAHQDKHEDAPGHRYDETKVMLDPYAKAVISRRHYGQLGPDLPYESEDVLGMARTWPQHACVLPGPADKDFDWEGDTPLNLPMEDLVIYEMHVRGFTQDASSGVACPGTYAGVVEKLDYLRSLGVNAIELLPLQEFNELEYYTPIPGSDPVAYRYNFWGYSTVGFFAPMSRYSAAIAQGRQGGDMVKELKNLVKECHKRGIEVILDVVFNHTAEGNHLGPSLSFRGLDNRVYYMLAPGGEYYNYSGCGNTFNCNQPIVRRFIVDCLRYWVEEYHIDGFRFDLASILTRAHSAWHPQEPPMEGEATAPLSNGAVVDANGYMTDGAGVATGTPLSDPPLIEMISEDPVLKGIKLIAEAWDCDGLNQVGAFPHYGGRWAEWNGRFRDTVRQFIKGTEGQWAGAFASAICGSPDLYANTQPFEDDWWGNNFGRKWKGGRTPAHSINFVTAHDGFTLADVAAYNEKHNDANGENNQDGEQHNHSWNCGEEGPTENMQVNRLRQRQIRNLAVALMVAHGVPMLCMGDEYGHTKRGNNNTYCHDSPLNWFDWDRAAYDEAGFLRFMRLLIRFRKERPELRRTQFVTDQDIQWHGTEPHKPDWTDSSRLVAFTLHDGQGGGLFVAFNTSHLPVSLTLPKWGGRVWEPLADTSRMAPFDFLAPDEQLSPADVEAAKQSMAMWVADSAYTLLPWSCCILQSVPEEGYQKLKVKGATATFLQGLSPGVAESAGLAGAWQQRNGTSGSW